MKYECQSCGNRFNKPRVHRERCEDYGYEEVCGCPHCGGGYIRLWEDEEDDEDDFDW